MLAWTLDEIAGAVYITLDQGDVDSQREVIPGALIVDIDAEGRPLGFEAIGQTAIARLRDLAAEYNLTGAARDLVNLVSHLGREGSNEPVRIRALATASA